MAPGAFAAGEAGGAGSLALQVRTRLPGAHHDVAPEGVWLEAFRVVVGFGDGHPVDGMHIAGRRGTQVGVRRAANAQHLEATAFFEGTALRLQIPRQETVKPRVRWVVLSQVDDAGRRIQRRGLVPEQAHVDNRASARAPRRPELRRHTHDPCRRSGSCGG